MNERYSVRGFQSCNLVPGNPSVSQLVRRGLRRSRAHCSSASGRATTVCLQEAGASLSLRRARSDGAARRRCACPTGRRTSILTLRCTPTQAAWTSWRDDEGTPAEHEGAPQSQGWQGEDSKGVSLAKPPKGPAAKEKGRKRSTSGKSSLLGSWGRPGGSRRGKKPRGSSSPSLNGKGSARLPPAHPRPKKLKVVPASALSVIPGVRMTASASLLEAQECGEIMESIDEAAFALDGLRDHCLLRVQQTSAASLASLCAAPQQRARAPGPWVSNFNCSKC